MVHQGVQRGTFSINFNTTFKVAGGRSLSPFLCASFFVKFFVLENSSIFRRIHHYDRKRIEETDRLVLFLPKRKSIFQKHRK